MSETAIVIPTLETARLRLRPLAVEDAPQFHAAYGDAATMRFWDAPPSPDVAETERRIRMSTGANPAFHAAWAVCDGESGQLLGMVNYHARQPWARRLAVGWILVPAAQGRGVMAEAMGALVGHCFEALDTHRIEAEIEPDNHRSARLAERLGFQREGLLRDRLYVGGQYKSAAMWSLLREY